MYNIITESDLIRLLENIRNSLHAIQENDTGNIVFMNLNSFFDFADNYALPHTYNLKSLVSEVEPYIPLSISDENLKIFLDAALSNDETLIKSLESAFVENAKAHFINSIYSANDEDSWNEIVRVCTAIRGYKESGALAPL